MQILINVQQLKYEDSVDVGPAQWQILLFFYFSYCNNNYCNCFSSVIMIANIVVVVFIIIIRFHFNSTCFVS